MKSKSFFVLFILSGLFLVQSAGDSFQKEETDIQLGIKIQSQKEHNEMLQFTSGAHILGFRGEDMFIASNDHALRVEFINAKPVLPVEDLAGLDTKDGQMSARKLDRVVYKDIWDSVSLVYENLSSGVVKKTYTIHSSGEDTQNPADQIRLHYNVPVEVDESGNLRLSFETGQMIESRPIAWQQIRGKRVPVEVAFHYSGDQEVSFRIESYNTFFPLTIYIDLYWNTFMGSEHRDYGSGIAVDTNGNVFVVGYSYASWGNPVNPHAGDGYSDAFVAKLNSSGVRQWHTFMGSTAGDSAHGIDIDTSGNIFVVGDSAFTWGTPINPFDGSATAQNAFVAKLNSSGVRQWHTFMGSSGRGIDTDTNGNIFVVGSSAFTWGIPISPHQGGGDVFVAKLNSDGVLQWHTFMGSANYDVSRGITVDTNGNIYTVGNSFDTWGTPENPHAGGGDFDAFVSKLNSDGVLQWNTFMGSANYDWSNSITVYTNGNVFVVGFSYASWGNPVNPHVGDGYSDAFVAKLNSSGVRQWHTFMGSTSGDSARGIDIDTNGNIFVVGSSAFTWGIPISPHQGGSDVFVAKINSDGVLQWHTFMGSTAGDSACGIDIDTNGNIFVVGNSTFTWGIPISPHQGGYDVFVAKIRQDNPPSASITSPTNNAVVFGMVNVETDTIDDFGIDKVEFEIDGDLIATDSTSPYSFLWNTGPVAAGQHYIKAIAHDTRGQTGEDEVQVTVNKMNLMLNASREGEQAWIIRREYGKINLNVIDWGVHSVMKFLIYRMKAGSEYQIIKEITPEEIQGNEYTFYDFYLEKNSLYTYKVIAIGWNSAPIGASGEKII